jgi:hypothetical protein
LLRNIDPSILKGNKTLFVAEGGNGGEDELQNKDVDMEESGNIPGEGKEAGGPEADQDGGPEDEQERVEGADQNKEKRGIPEEEEEEDDESEKEQEPEKVKGDI